MFTEYILENKCINLIVLIFQLQLVAESVSNKKGLNLFERKDGKISVI